MKNLLFHSLAAVFIVVAWMATFALTSPRSNNVELVQPNVVARVNANQKTGVATIAVYNGTSRAAKIDWVHTNCGCVPAGNHKGKRISAGGLLNLDFHPDVPTVGSRRTTIRIKHSLAERPLVAYITVDGRSEPPMLEHVQNGSPTFFAVSPGGEEQKVVVKTKERIESKPWIRRLMCDAASVELATTAIDERPPESRGYLARTYTFTVRIKSALPAGREVASDLWVEAEDVKKERIKIGSIQAASIQG